MTKNSFDLDIVNTKTLCPEVRGCFGNVVMLATYLQHRLEKMAKKNDMEDVGF